MALWETTSTIQYSHLYCAGVHPRAQAWTCHWCDLNHVLLPVFTDPANHHWQTFLLWVWTRPFLYTAFTHRQFTSKKHKLIWVTVETCIHKFVGFWDFVLLHLWLLYSNMFSSSRMCWLPSQNKNSKMCSSWFFWDFTINLCYKISWECWWKLRAYLIHFHIDAAYFVFNVECKVNPSLVNWTTFLVWFVFPY